MFSKNSKNEDPWYIHAGLYFIVAILTFLLIKVAVIDPSAEVEAEKYYKVETRLRMANLKEAQILFQKKNGAFTASLDKLIDFIKNDRFVDSVVNAVVNPAGKLLRVDTKTVIGTKYYIEDPNGYGTIGSIDNDALKNTASWE